MSLDLFVKVLLPGILGLSTLLLLGLYTALAQERPDEPAGGMTGDRRAALSRAMAEGSVAAALDLARLAIAQGRYEQAVGALTGLRARDPSNPRIALLLGELYSRMGVPAQARLYFREALESERLNPAEKRTARARLGLIDEDRPGTDAIWDLRARVSSGVRYSTNANNGIDPDSILIGDVRQPRSERLEPEDDWNGYLLAFGRATRPITQDLSLNFQGLFYGTAHAEHEDENVAAARVQPGLIWDVVKRPAFGLRFQGYGIFGATALGQEHALNQVGGGVRAIQRLGGDWFFDQTLEARSLNYHNTDTRPALDDQSGDDIRLELGLRHRLSDQLTARLAYQINSRDTGEAHLDRTGHRLRATAIWQFAAPWFGSAGSPQLRGDVTFLDTRHAAPPPFVSSEIEREDRKWVFDLELTVPLVNALSVEVGADFSRTDSNLPNYERDEFSVSTGLRLDF